MGPATRTRIDDLKDHHAAAVGFIGLGTMGAAMAANLARAGFGITVWNRSPVVPRTSTNWVPAAPRRPPMSPRRAMSS